MEGREQGGVGDGREGNCNSKSQRDLYTNQNQPVHQQVKEECRRYGQAVNTFWSPFSGPHAQHSVDPWYIGSRLLVKQQSGFAFHCLADDSLGQTIRVHKHASQCSRSYPSVLMWQDLSVPVSCASAVSSPSCEIHLLVSPALFRHLLFLGRTCMRIL